MVARGLAENCEQAARAIRAGQVRVASQPADKPGHLFPEDSDIAVIAQSRFVSRGGDKLEAAFAAFNLDVKDLVCLDVGSSTGGFTDCMLQHGAKKVYAVDVGTDQIHWKLKNDKRVVVMENINARYLRPGDLPEPVSFATIDVSFISLTLILRAVTDVIKSGGLIISLIKPQFEARPEQVEKGGVVRNPETRQAVIEKIKQFGTSELGLEWLGVKESPLKGPAGNVEFLACWRCEKR